MAVRDEPINGAQAAYLERALAITREQLQAVESMLFNSPLDRRVSEDPVVIAAAMQALAINYLAERTKS